MNKLGTLINCSGKECGYLLLSVALLLISLMSVVFVCAFVSGRYSDNDDRYIKTARCMNMIRYALSGKQSSGGGFISDYGEPDNMTPFAPGTDNFTGALLNRQSVPAWREWSHSGPPGEFWAGYRGSRYLSPFAGEWNENPPFPHEFFDGWGNPVAVKFIQDTTPEHTIIEIKSFGSNGVSGGTGDYREDLTDRFYWKREVNIGLQLDITSLAIPNGTNVDITAELVYPFKGSILLKEQTLTLTVNSGLATANYNFPVNPPGDMTPLKFPVGRRKIIWVLKTDLDPWGGPSANSILADRIIIIPSSTVVSDPPDPPDAFSTNTELVI